MKHKTRYELKVEKTKDPFHIMDKIKTLEGIYSINLMDANTIVLFYDDRKLNEQQIKKTA